MFISHVDERAATMSIVPLLLLCFFLTVQANQKLIVVLIDGVRWDYLKDPNLKGFRRLMDNGVKAPYVLPVYPSLSYPNWYSIVTGLYPESHGFLDNHLYDNETDSFYLSSSDPHASDPLWWNEAEPIWITAEKHDRRSAMYWWNGCEVRIKDHNPMICEKERFGPPTPEEKEDFIERIDDIVELFKPSKRFPKDRLSLVLMYYGPPDYTGHAYGPKSPKTKEALYQIDSILDKMQTKLAKAGLTNDVNIMVVSDHGMTELRDTQYIELEKFSSDIKYQVSRGTASMVVPEDGKIEKLYSDLKKANLKGLDVYKKEEIPTRYHIKDSKRITPIYLVAHNGYLIKGLRDEKKNPLGQPGYSYIGMHGYDVMEVEDMKTIFVASGPAFKRGKFETEALNITDLYNVMCHILQLEPLPNNGSWEKVRSMLRTQKAAQNVQTSFMSSASFLHPGPLLLLPLVFWHLLSR